MTQSVKHSWEKQNTKSKSLRNTCSSVVKTKHLSRDLQLQWLWRKEGMSGIATQVPHTMSTSHMSTTVHTYINYYACHLQIISKTTYLLKPKKFYSVRDVREVQISKTTVKEALWATLLILKVWHITICYYHCTFMCHSYITQ